MDVMITHAFMKVLPALLIVVILTIIFAVLAKRLGFAKASISKQISENRRIKLIETFVLDPKRRLVVIEWAGEDHLLLLNQQGDLVIKSKILDLKIASAPQSGELKTL